MKFDYSKWQGPKPEDVAFVKQLTGIDRDATEAFLGAMV